MPDPTTVSVVMPVHNGADHVTEAIASALGQGGVALEILVHDDGSTDTTARRLAELAASDPRVTVSAGPNRGPATSRNHLLDRARGSYVAFLDHDDLWPPGRLARQLAILERCPEAPGALGETIIFDALDPRGQPRETPGWRRTRCGLLQAGLFRSEAVATAAPFDVTLRPADDFDFLLRLIDIAGPLAVDPEVAAWYRIRPDRWTADLHQSGLATARVLARSLQRRRTRNITAPPTGQTSARR